LISDNSSFVGVICNFERKNLLQIWSSYRYFRCTCDRVLLSHKFNELIFGSYCRYRKYGQQALQSQRLAFCSIALLNLVIMLKSYHVIFFLCLFSTYIGALAICSNGNLGVRQTGVASVCPLQLQFFNFPSAPYIQDCVVPPSALSQPRIWSFVPIQVAVESAILEREHPYSRHKIFQIGSLP